MARIGDSRYEEPAELAAGLVGWLRIVIGLERGLLEQYRTVLEREDG